jgi:Rrf2 family transcriptional regulator, iron-sulfur cluster assembly transcription factor
MITRDADYAIRAVCCIAGLGSGKVTVTDLSGKLGIPRPFLRKIFQTLNKSGLLKSSKGKGGGFSLTRDPKKITVLELMEIFQGTFLISEHVFKGKTCPEIRKCALKKKIDKIEKDIKKELGEITISSLIKG